jgi:hypothetical protein
MRHRKVLNLYDTDPGHEQLLIYLEGIEGPTRQSQALIQMALVGYRVMALQEGGEEAYLRVRNPDISAFSKPTRRQAITRAIEHSASDEVPRHGSNALPPAPRQRPGKEAPAPLPGANTTPRQEGRTSVPAPEPEQKPAQRTDAMPQANDLEHIAHEDLNDEFNTLKILQRMGEAD